MSFLDSVSARYQQNPNPQAMQKLAWAEFQRLGLPSRRDENWKYSSLDGLTRQEWQPGPKDQTISAPMSAWCERWKDTFDVLVVVNGDLRRDLSAISTELKECLGASDLQPTIFEDGLGNLAAALSRPGVYLRVPNGVRVQRPVFIVRAQVGESSWDAGESRIQIGENARLDLVEVFTGEGSTYLRTELAQARVSAGAELNWLRVQRESGGAHHFSEVRSQIEGGGRLHFTQVNAGAAWARSSVRADLLGREADVHINGLSFGSDHQHIDQRVAVHHLAGESQSSQLFKNVLRDRSRGILNGKIYIARDAQKVSSAQYNHSLLVGTGAEADTKPELEIYADDVKANHGASVGRLQADRLFYLESRGIPPQQAQAMLTLAFVEDVAMKVPTRDLRAALQTFLQELAR